jgi:acyl-CoA dehydrogenase
MPVALVLLALAALIGLLYAGRGRAGWIAAGALLLGAWIWGGVASGLLFGIALLAFAAAVVVSSVPGLRRRALAAPAMRLVGPLLPRIGATERVALEAGTVWWDGQLFSGDPDWQRLLAFEVAPLSDRERAFLDGPVEQVCRMLDDWEVMQERDLPPAVWERFKKDGFFGMILPEEHGGLGFSAAAHSAVVVKLASRSIAAAVTVMVPNSLGPGELLLHYGTEEQKSRYLPRLARGEEVPCFALTGPEAGSDAAATQSVGVVCRGTWRGEPVVGMRLRWNKRYITLCPVATLIGLAFRLLDPDHLLGDREDLGITCALVPSDLPGIEIGKRHDPMGIPFQNGPTIGRDVFVPLDAIIGGPEMAGKGWRMLMESLAAGRSISLPALSVGAAELATRVVGAYATVREQFDTPIGRFEGIEDPLARMGGLTYLMDAARRLTAGAVDAGEKPAVLSAVVKAYLTEGMRDVLNDAMDVRAGAGVVRGPRNILSRAYTAVPIGITVEGANILTRSMIIYGQGAIRCHPFAQQEMEAVAARDLARFDRAFFGHVNHVFSTATRCVVRALTDGRSVTRAPEGDLRRGLQRLSRLSSAFALVSDGCMATLGGELKRRERISGRLADALAWMYLGSAAAKRFHDEGRPAADRPLLLWSLEHAIHQVEEALRGVIENLPSRPAAALLRVLVFPLGVRYRPPSDALASRVARALLEDRDTRLRLTRGIFVPDQDEPGLGQLEAALDQAVEALAVEAKVRDAVRAGRLDHAPGQALLDQALEAGVIGPSEHKAVLRADAARDEVIQVDAFEPEVYETLR